MRKSASLLAVILFLFASAATAQTGTIKGFVYDKKTGEPLIYTNVLVVNSSKGVQTDNNGYFSLALPPGTYTLLTTTLGYDTSLITVNLLADALVNKKIMLKQLEMELKTVEISGGKKEKTTRINTGLTNIANYNYAFRVFPNPASGFININCDNALKSQLTVNITDELGRVAGTYTMNGTELHVNTESFAPGFYFYKSVEENGSFAGEGKFIVRKN